MEDDWKENIEWDDLLNEIRSGQCVLVVGPELVEFENQQTLFQRLCQQLSNNERTKRQLDLPTPQFFFENEELLQLSERGRDTSLYEFYKNFYAQRLEFDEPFKKIAQLPFSLIISLLPDRRLPETFDQLNLPKHFGYYSIAINETTVIEKPSTDKPLIYNIMGDIQEKDMVFTFDHLFTYLKGIMGPRPLPTPILTTFQNATSFLFLGVRFEKWYMQMLLRIILADNKQKLLKYSLLQNKQNPEACTFIARRLKLDFLETSPSEFLDEIFTRGQLGNILSKPQKKKVFISYSHSDKIIATAIAQQLKLNDIDVFIDESSMLPGDKIRHFMEIVRDMDIFIVIVSKNSLQSPWVSHEISIARSRGIRIIPCHLYDFFSDDLIVHEIIELAKNKIRKFNRLNFNLIDDSPLQITDELKDDEENLWRELGLKASENIAHLKGSKSITITSMEENPIEFDHVITLLTDTVFSRVKYVS